MANTSAPDFTNTTEERLANVTAGSVARQEEWKEGGEVVGYHVSMRIGGLRQRESYVFSVAAASVVGVGEFSDRSRTLTLEDGGRGYFFVLFHFMVGSVFFFSCGFYGAKHCDVFVNVLSFCIVYVSFSLNCDLGSLVFPSLPELLLYLIVGGVVGGVLLVLVLLIVFCFLAQYIRRQHRGGKISESHL